MNNNICLTFTFYEQKGLANFSNKHFPNIYFLTDKNICPMLVANIILSWFYKYSSNILETCPHMSVKYLDKICMTFDKLTKVRTFYKYSSNISETFPQMSVKYLDQICMIFDKPY